MKKATTIVSILMIASTLLPTGAFAATVGVNCGDINPQGFVIDCGSGNPENVVNYGGYTNSQLPKVAPGSYAADGKSLCPIFFTTACVDITRTAYYLALHQ